MVIYFGPVNQDVRTFVRLLVDRSPDQHYSRSVTVMAFLHGIDVASDAQDQRF